MNIEDIIEEIRLPAGRENWELTSQQVDRAVEDSRSYMRSLTKGLVRDKQPLMRVISGIPGSGKTTYAKQLLSQSPNSLYLNFDDIMEHLSGYQHDFHNIGPEGAFGKWELPARYLGYGLLMEAGKMGLNIIFDHSNSVAGHIELLSAFRELGYRIEIYFIDISIDEALARTKTRERFLPENLITERYNILEELNPLFKQIADKFEII